MRFLGRREELAARIERRFGAERTGSQDFGQPAASAFNPHWARRQDQIRGLTSET